MREDGSLVTGRDYPQLTQLSAEIKAGILTLAVGSLPRLSLDLNALESKDRHFLKYVGIYLYTFLLLLF